MTVGELKRYLETAPDNHLVLIQLNSVYSEANEICVYDHSVFINGQSTARE
jgi:hypothetical protein